MNIYDKIFTYISTKNGFNTLVSQHPDVLEKYKNSLIFIGEEQQIYQPLTNTYIGIGMSKYNELKTLINQSGQNLVDFNTYIHNEVVTNIYGQYGKDDLNNIYNTFPNTYNVGSIAINSLNQNYLTKANRDVVIKGIYDYDPNNHYGLTYSDIDINDGNNPANPYIHQKSSTTYGTSGIHVKVTHAGQYKTGIDAAGFEYSYWDGTNVLTIDDTLTWTYIGHNNDEIKKFARKVAADEANRIYQNILGEDVNYISKDLSSILYYDPVTNTIANNRVYIKKKDDNTSTGTKYVPVYISPTPDNDGTYTLYEGEFSGNNIIQKNPGSPITLAYYNPSTGVIELPNNLDNSTLNLSPNDGYIPGQTTDSISEIIWYTEDPTSAIPYNYNLRDGINTIKEVAYLLDILTDGTEDDGINLAYNISSNYIEIENLKQWKNNTANPASSDFVTSFNSSSDPSNFIILNSFSTSQAGEENKGDIQLNSGLILAYTYILNVGGNNVSYAAYTDGQISGNQYTRYISYTNYDSVNNYIDITSPSDNNNRAELINKLLAAGESNNYPHDLYEKNTDGTFSLSSVRITLGELISSGSNITIGGKNAYIFFPYKEYTQHVSQGITTVEWVTTYVSHGFNELKDSLNHINVDSDIAAALDKLDASYTAQVGKYISSISQEDGKIQDVTFTAIPKDEAFGNQIISSGDEFVKLDYSKVVVLNNANNTAHIYFINSSGIFEQLGQNPISADIQYYWKNELGSNKFILVNDSTNPLTGITDTSTLQDLIGLPYNFFKKVTVGSKDTYVPVDIQEEINNLRSVGPNPDYTLNTNSIYYLNDSSFVNRFNKYIDVSTERASDGHTYIGINAYVSYLGAAISSSNTGLADAYDVRRTIERMFTWIDLTTNADFVRAS